jgi:hypothetical protein
MLVQRNVFYSQCWRTHWLLAAFIQVIGSEFSV